MPYFCIMNSSNNNIHPIFDTTLSKEDKEKQLNQRAVVLWMIGLSGSGKSTIAKGLEKKLHSEGYFTQLLDGDNLRVGINNNLGFSIEDRNENIRRASEVAKLFYNCGIITICSFISPTKQIRSMVQTILGNSMKEVYINTPLEECENRDVKGLYKKARAGEIKGFTGIDSPFEAPVNPDIEIQTKNISIEQSVDALYHKIIEHIKYK